MDLSAFRNGLEVIVPQPLTIRVPITGYPTPTAKWTFGEKELSPSDDRVSMVTKSTFTELTVSPSVRPDKGTYGLTLENDVSSVSGEIEVNVIGNYMYMQILKFHCLIYTVHKNTPDVLKKSKTVKSKFYFQKFHNMNLIVKSYEQ